MPATATGRGAQVVLDPQSDTQKAVRGAFAATQEANVAKVQADIAAGLVADGNGPDGTTNTGGAALDHAVMPQSGTKAADNAPTGSIGEFQSATALQGRVTLTTNVQATVVTLQLSAGDWDVTGLLSLSGTASAVTFVQLWVAPTAGAAPAPPAAGMLSLQGNAPGTNNNLTTGYRRFSLATAGTAFLCCVVTFTGGTCLVGGIIQARRAR